MIDVVQPPTRWTVGLVGLEGRVNPGQAIAIDAEGRAHVAWTQGPRARPKAMLSSRSQSADGPEWVSREVHPGAADSDDAAIAADPGGALHLVWTARSAPRGSRWLLYARSDDQGRRWSEPEILQDPRRFGSASEPQLAIDEGGFLHVAWQSAATREQPGRVWYSTRSLGQPFLPPVQLNQSERGARKARLSAQGSALGTLAVAWLDARDAREGETREELYVGLVLDGGREIWDQRVTFSGDAEEGGEEHEGAIHRSCFRC